MSELQFVEFEEVNDHEGETWVFWLQLTGNEVELDKFEQLLTNVESEDPYFDFPYTLRLENVEHEPVVDKLVEYAHEGYMDSHNKVTGVFKCPDSLGEDAEALYKGGIKDYFS